MKKEINIVLRAPIEGLREDLKAMLAEMVKMGKGVDKEMKATFASVDEALAKIATSKNTGRAVKQLQNLALLVQELGPEFEGMANKIIQAAGGIKDEVGDVAAQIDYFSSDTKKLDALMAGLSGLASAFQVVRGATALLGDENEDMKKTMMQLTASMSLIQGLQEVRKVLLKEEAFLTGLNAAQQKLLAFETYATASAMNAFKVALAGTGIGLALVAVTAFVSKMMESREAAKKAAEEQSKFADELQKSRESTTAQGVTLKSYYKILSDTTKSENQRKEALKQINDLGVETTDININNSDSLKILKGRIDDVVLSLQKKAIAESYNNRVAELANKLTKEKGMAAALEGAALDRLNTAYKFGHEVGKAQADLDDLKLRNSKKVAEAERQLTEVIQMQQQAVEDYIDAQSKVKTKDDSKKNTDAKKNALKKQEDILKSTLDLRTSEINANKNSALVLAKTEAEKALIELNAKNEILDLQEKYLIEKENLQSKENKNAIELKNSILAINNEKISNQAEYQLKLSEIEKKQIEDDKKQIEELKKQEEEYLKFVQESSKSEIDAIKNYYQQLENKATENNNAGLTNEKEYQSELLKIRIMAAENSLQAMKDAGEKNTAELEAQILALKNILSKGGEDMAANTQNFTSSINSSLQSITSNGFEQIGIALGESILTGSSFLESAFTIVLDSISQFLQAYGKAMIAFGVAGLAVDQAIKTMNPIAAVVAGTALVATSVLVKSVAQNGVSAFADGGIVSGPTLGLVGEYANASTNPEVIAPLDKLKSIIGTTGDGTSGGYIAETRISGRDLAIILKREKEGATRG
jgi:hypothetical protein